MMQSNQPNAEGIAEIIRYYTGLQNGTVDLAAKAISDLIRLKRPGPSEDEIARALVPEAFDNPEAGPFERAFTFTADGDRLRRIAHTKAKAVLKLFEAARE